jgi:hypothetical protein
MIANGAGGGKQFFAFCHLRRSEEKGNERTERPGRQVLAVGQERERRLARGPIQGRPAYPALLSGSFGVILQFYMVIILH